MSSGEPPPGARVGIFWIDGRELIAFSEAAADVPAVAGFRDSELGHDALWAKVVATRPAWREREYFDIPRGRVLYNERTGMFHVFVPSKFAADAELASRITAEFRLRASRWAVKCDTHYDPLDADEWEDDD